MRCRDALRQLSSIAQRLRSLSPWDHHCSCSGLDQGSCRAAIRTNKFAHFATATTQFNGDELTVAVILERLPVVTPEPPQWAIEHHKWLSEIANRKRVEKPDSWIDIDKDKTDRDLQEVQWQPADRVTEADRAGDIKSLQRCLDRRLYFVVKEQDSQQWRLPQRLHNNGESMRAAAERVLQECTQPRDALQIFFLGQGPIGHMNKLFFHRAQLIKGSLLPKPGAGLTDHAWLSQDELVEQTQDASLKGLLAKML